MTSWVEVSVGALRHNTAAVAGLVAPAALTAVVKANGYGHGALLAARAALAGGATQLAVTTVA
ncbi:MAG: alanine racemase, partial [Fimbriimonadaceae bacterium]|nr:alanine racemase [Fimbriimonadaceae bacterium]